MWREEEVEAWEGRVAKEEAGVDKGKHCLCLSQRLKQAILKSNSQEMIHTACVKEKHGGQS
jgi:hypothetical protein